jgi:hypothetical protein
MRKSTQRGDRLISDIKIGGSIILYHLAILHVDTLQDIIETLQNIYKKQTKDMFFKPNVDQHPIYYQLHLE